MSSGKPQTRGLAALLRIEKERRAREESYADESSVPESVQDRSAPRALPYQVSQTDPDAEAPSTAAETFSDTPQQAPVQLSQEVGTPHASPQQSDVAAPHASSEIGEHRPGALERVASPITSLPRTRPTQARQVRQARAPRQKANSQSEPILGADPGWEKFVAEWKPFLREGVKFKLCEYFYRNTTALGQREFKTSTAQLSRVSGAHRRHIFLVLRQLEDLRFIQKENLVTNRKDEGLVIRFFPDRQA